MGSFDRIPIIDIGEINQIDGPGIKSIVRQIQKAYGTAGFAYLRKSRCGSIPDQTTFSKIY